jgi:hypothetical protein
MKSQPHPTSVRLSPEAHALIQILRDYYGLSQTAVLEMAVRELARKINFRPNRTS